MWAIVGKETRQCPPEFQARLTRMFGKNPFGEPIFKIVWGSSVFHRMGNTWMDKDGTTRIGFRDKYLCPGGIPAWNILRWKSAREFGTPDLWYDRTWDPVSHLYALGEYPWRGRYEVLQPLYSKEFVDGKLVIDPLPLTHILVDTIIPIMLRARQATAEERRAAVLYARQEQHRRDVAATEEIMMENLPAYYGPVSFTRQGIKTALITRKMDAIQKQWDKLTRRGRRPTFRQARGFFRGNAPNPN